MGGLLIDKTVRTHLETNENPGTCDVTRAHPRGGSQTSNQSAQSNRLSRISRLRKINPRNEMSLRERIYLHAVRLKSIEACLAPKR